MLPIDVYPPCITAEGDNRCSQVNGANELLLFHVRWTAATHHDAFLKHKVALERFEGEGGWKGGGRRKGGQEGGEEGSKEGERMEIFWN